MAEGTRASEGVGGRPGAGGSTGPAGLDRADGLLAAIAGLTVFATYLATMFPGLHDVGDAAKFSFVGKVLGTPHPPGYPLYVMVSHLFSYVPWGTLAYRMNALSAIFGALAVVLTYLVTRRLGAGRMAAAAAALALGFGDAFWSRALYAKGYTLNAALVAAGVLALLRWDRTRRTRDLYLAACIFSLSLGNHLIVIALLPVVVLFPLLTDARAALRPRTVATVLLLALLGLAQYGYILVRTRQGAPYLEARASTVSELVQVMTARRFVHEIGAFSGETLVGDRIPRVAGMTARELGPVGVPLLAVGLVALTVRRPRRAVLFGLGALSVALFTANMGSQEDEGFMLPVFVLSWPVAGLGLQQVTAWLGRRPHWSAAGLAVATAAALPSSLVIANYRANDHHADTADIEYFDALFAALPDKAAVVGDEYRVDMMLLYKLLGEEAAGARDIRLVRQDRDRIATLRREGFEVLAFDHGRAALREYGLRFGPFRAPPELERMLERRPLHRLLAEPVCLELGNRGWMDAGSVLRPHGLASLRIDNYRAFDARVTLYAGTDARPAPVMAGQTGAGSPVASVNVFPAGDGAARQRLDAQLAADGARLPEALREAPFVVRIDLLVNDKGAFFATGLDVGASTIGAVARATVDLDNPRRAMLCSHPLAGVTSWPDDLTTWRVAVDAAEVEFTDGWYTPERRPDGRQFRWTAERATLMLALDRPRSARVVLVGEPLSYDGRPEGSVDLVVNGEAAGTRPLPAGSSRFAWDVPESRWRRGLNTVVIEVTGAKRPADVGPSGDRRVLGLSVAQIELTAAGGGERR